MRFGRYDLLDRIAAGGMGEILLASLEGSRGFRKFLAIKRMLPHLGENPEFEKMFCNEAAVAARLSHANIVQVFDVGRAQDTYFLVMEFVDGWNLRRILHRVNEVGTRLPIGLAVFIAIETLKGLAYAHEKKDENGRPLKGAKAFFYKCFVGESDDTGIVEGENFRIKIENTVSDPSGIRIHKGKIESGTIEKENFCLL